MRIVVTFLKVVACCCVQLLGFHSTPSTVLAPWVMGMGVSLRWIMPHSSGGRPRGMISDFGGEIESPTAPRPLLTRSRAFSMCLALVPMR